MQKSDPAHGMPASMDAAIARRFATVDADGSGLIEKNDFELSTRRLLSEFDIAADSEAGKQLMDAAITAWGHLVQHADADGAHPCRAPFSALLLHHDCALCNAAVRLKSTFIAALQETEKSR